MPFLSTLRPVHRSWAACLLGALAGLFVASHLVAIGTEGINWDELALLNRAERTLVTGVLDGGGRPGLATLVLLPLVDGCQRTIALVHRARLLWAILTFAYLGGVYALARAAGARRAGALLAVGALALAPPFLRWSLQVRSDQLALAATVWAGVAGLASLRRQGRTAFVLAAAAGLLACLGYLASQKAVYLLAVTTLIAVAWLAQARTATGASPASLLRLAAGRVLVAGGAAGAGWFAFRGLVRLSFGLPPAYSLERGLQQLEWYREVLGMGAYAAMAPGLWPQVLLVGALVPALLLLRPRDAHGFALWALPLALLALGGGIAAFHAAAFPYFWLTLGLLPALALGLGTSALSAAGPPQPAWWLLAWLPLVGANVGPALALLHDTQAVQRESYDLAESAFPPPANGFQVEGGLLCRGEHQPIPRMLSQHIAARFFGPAAAAEIADLLAEHRRRPVAFILSSHRMQQFPPEVQRFWRDHYAPYRAALLVPAAAAQLAPGKRASLEILVAGPYRVQAADGLVARLDGATLADGAVVELAAGIHAVEGVAGAARLQLRWALAEPPGATAAFYSEEQIYELSGHL